MVVAMHKLLLALNACSLNWARGNRNLQPATVPNEATEQWLAAYPHEMRRNPPTAGDLWTDPPLTVE